MKGFSFVLLIIILSFGAWAQGITPAPNNVNGPFGFAGAVFTVASGCGTTGSLTGGTTSGSFTAGATGCAPVITLPTAKHGWICRANDLTTTADLLVQTAKTTTSCTVSGTVSSSDVILFFAVPY